MKNEWPTFQRKASLEICLCTNSYKIGKMPVSGIDSTIWQYRNVSVAVHYYN